MKLVETASVKSASKMLLAMTTLVVVAFGVSAFAAGDDELLDLLGNGAAPSAAKTKTVQASELRKVLKSPTAEQNIFIQFFDKGDMEKALFQWPTAFDGTSFGRSPSGKALNALLLFRNGIKVSSLEALLSIDKPSEIAAPIVKMWQEAAPVSDSAWGLVQVAKWNQFWTQEFGSAAEIRVRSRQVYNSDQVATLKDLIKKTQADSPERSWLSWQLVLAMSTGDDPGTAAKALAVLMKAPNNPISQDLMTITAARLLYQNGFLDAALKYYEKVPKASDYWFDSQEEMGWAYIRKGEPQNTIAVTKTLTLPEFTAEIGPEPMFLRSLGELKVCDYPAVVATLNDFRNRYKVRAKDLMAISESSENKDVESYITRARKETMTLKKLGKEAQKLPRFVTRDEVLSQAIATQAALEKEAKIAADLYARSLSGGTGQVGFQARLEEFRKAADSRALEARGATYNRVKTLAQEEVNEIAQILQKLHIVEAEVLQQISMAGRVADASTTQKATVRDGTTGSHAKDRLTFPAETETWFDELANYKVDIKKGCQSAKR